MRARMENMISGRHEKPPEIFIELLSTLVPIEDKQDVRSVIGVFVRKGLFNALFAFGYGTHHLWVTQKKVSDSDQCLENKLLIVEPQWIRLWQRE